MRYLGRFQLGQFMPLDVQCFANSVTEVAPTSAPTFTVYKADDTPVVSDVKMAIQAKGSLTGWFRGEIFLNATYSAGRYHGIIEYASSGSSYSEEFVFDVIPGGNATGEYIGMYFYERPHARFCIGLSDAGTLEFRRNPSAS